MKIALHQMAVGPDFEKNLAEVEKAFNQNAGADLLVLPELFTSGFRYKELEKYSQLNRQSLGKIRQLCRQSKTGFIGSLLWKAKKQYYNRLFYFDKAGAELAHYDKVNLIPAFKEPKYLAPGRGPVSAPAPRKQISMGLSICYDLRFPELFRHYARQEAELIVCVAQWPRIRLAHLVALAKARAIENQAFFVLVNTVGLCRGQDMAGQSMVINPWGNTILNLKRKRGSAQVNIDFKEQKKYRSDFPALRQFRKKPFFRL